MVSSIPFVSGYRARFFVEACPLARLLVVEYHLTFFGGAVGLPHFFWLWDPLKDFRTSLSVFVGRTSALLFFGLREYLLLHSWAGVFSHTFDGSRSTLSDVVSGGYPLTLSWVGVCMYKGEYPLGYNW